MPDGPKYWRNAVLSIDVTRYWLTNDGEDDDVAGGWKELESQLESAVRRVTQGKQLEVHFLEWQGPAEAIDASP